MGLMRNTYKVLVGNPEGKKPLGLSRRSREDNIKPDPREIKWEIVDWFHLAQGREQRRSLMNIAVKRRVPLKAVNFLTE
jgi:hypothetical protein